MRIKKAEYINDYKIKMLFSDGMVKIVDFKPLLKNAKNLSLPLLDIEYFKKFYIDEITICWPNQMDFCPDVLHEIGEQVQNEPQKTTKTRHRKNIAIAACAMTRKRLKQIKN